MATGVCSLSNVRAWARISCRSRSSSGALSRGGWLASRCRRVPRVPDDDYICWCLSIIEKKKAPNPSVCPKVVGRSPLPYQIRVAARGLRDCTELNSVAQVVQITPARRGDQTIDTEEVPPSALKPPEYLRWHREWYYPVAAQIRAALPRFRHVGDVQ